MSSGTMGSADCWKIAGQDVINIKNPILSKAYQFYTSRRLFYEKLVYKKLVLR